MSENNTTENNGQPQVSEEWKTIFDLLEKIGANESLIHIKTNNYKALSLKEQIKVSFNPLAFLFGPFYYFYKEMRLKGAFIFGATLILTAILQWPSGILSYWLFSGVFYSLLANYDYYKKIKNNEKMWEGMPEILSRPIGAIGFPLGALALLLGISIFNAITEHSESRLSGSESTAAAGAGSELLTRDTSNATLRKKQEPVSEVSIECVMLATTIFSISKNEILSLSKGPSEFCDGLNMMIVMESNNTCHPREVIPYIAKNAEKIFDSSALAGFPDSQKKVIVDAWTEAATTVAAKCKLK